MQAPGLGLPGPRRLRCLGGDLPRRRTPECRSGDRRSQGLVFPGTPFSWIATAGAYCSKLRQRLRRGPASGSSSTRGLRVAKRSSTSDS